MKSLADNFVLDPEPSAVAVKHRDENKQHAKFDQKWNEASESQSVRDERPINPLSDLLSGLAV